MGLSGMDESMGGWSPAAKDGEAGPPNADRRATQARRSAPGTSAGLYMPSGNGCTGPFSIAELRTPVALKEHLKRGKGARGSGLQLAAVDEAPPDYSDVTEEDAAAVVAQWDAKRQPLMVPPPPSPGCRPLGPISPADRALRAWTAQERAGAGSDGSAGPSTPTGSAAALQPLQPLQRPFGPRMSDCGSGLGMGALPPGVPRRVSGTGSSTSAYDSVVARRQPLLLDSSPLLLVRQGSGGRAGGLSASAEGPLRMSCDDAGARAVLRVPSIGRRAPLMRQSSTGGTDVAGQAAAADADRSALVTPESVQPPTDNECSVEGEQEELLVSDGVSERAVEAEPSELLSPVQQAPLSPVPPPPEAGTGSAPPRRMRPRSAMGCASSQPPQGATTAADEASPAPPSPPAALTVELPVEDAADADAAQPTLLAPAVNSPQPSPPPSAAGADSARQVGRLKLPALSATSPTQAPSSPTPRLFVVSPPRIRTSGHGSAAPAPPPSPPPQALQQRLPLQIAPPARPPPPPAVALSPGRRPSPLSAGGGLGALNVMGTGVGIQVLRASHGGLPGSPTSSRSRCGTPPAMLRSLSGQHGAVAAAAAGKVGDGTASGVTGGGGGSSKLGGGGGGGGGGIVDSVLADVRSVAREVDEELVASREAAAAAMATRATNRKAHLAGVDIGGSLSGCSSPNARRFVSMPGDPWNRYG